MLEMPQECTDARDTGLTCVHLPSDSSQGLFVASVHPSMEQRSCARRECTHRHLWKSLDEFAYCCNACKHNEAWHTRNCTGAGQRVQPAAGEPAVGELKGGPIVSRAVAACYRSWFLPWKWTRGARPVLETVTSWYSQYWHQVLLPEAIAMWKTFASVVSAQTEHDMLERKLRLYAFAADQVPADLESVNVHKAGVDGYSPLYHLRNVSGIDYCVQGRLAMQENAISALCQAVEKIIGNDLSEFAFVCEHGTHRSVGCMMLLATLAFQRAKIVPTTIRTREAAGWAGLISCGEH